MNHVREALRAASAELLPQQRADWYNPNEVESEQSNGADARQRTRNETTLDTCVSRTPYTTSPHRAPAHDREPADDSNTADAPDSAGDWVAQLTRGEGAGLRIAYQQHHQILRAFSTRLLGDEQAAEDLVQEVFLCLPRAIHQFRRESKVESFLLGLAANKAKHHVRAAARRRAAMARYAEHDEPSLPATDEEVARRQLADKLHDALETLSLEQRSAFVLCAIEERNATEVAQILSCPPSTVRDRLSRARARLEQWARKEGLT